MKALKTLVIAALASSSAAAFACSQQTPGAHNGRSLQATKDKVAFVLNTGGTSTAPTSSEKKAIR